MRNTRRAGLAIVAGALLAVLAACAGTQGSAGAVGSESEPSAAPGVITPSGDSSVQDGGAANNNGGHDTGGAGNNNGGHGNNGTGNNGGPSASAAPSPAPSGARKVRPGPVLVGNYSVVALHECYWMMNAATELQLRAKFEIKYSGLFAAKPVPFVLSNDRDNYSTYGTKDPGTPFTLTIGGSTFAASAYPGHSVTLTLKITPSTADSNASDNSASVTVNVPASQPGIDLLNPLPC